MISLRVSRLCGVRLFVGVFALASAFQAAGADEQGSPRAQAGWRELTAGEQQPPCGEREQEFACFMRAVELSDQRYRRLGLQFWENHPEDPRRYHWLLATVVMPPRYPKDLKAWAENEARLSPPPYAVDAKAAQRWEKAYPALRQAFWASTAVRETERRLLWHAEIHHALDRMLRGPLPAKPADVEWLATQVVEFVRAYPERFTERDTDYLTLVSSPVDRMFEHASELGMDAAARGAFAQRLQLTGNQQASAMARHRAASAASGKPRESAPPRNDINAQLQSRMRGYPGVSYELPREVFVVNPYHRALSGRVYRDLGAQLWERSTNHEERQNWLVNTHLNYKVQYFTNFAEGIRLMALNRPDEAGTDAKAEARWERRYAPMRAALLADPQTTEQERRNIQYADFTERMERVARRWAQQRDRAAVESMLYDITSSGFAYAVYQNPLRYGLSEQDLRNFTARLIGREDKSLRELAQARQRLFDLRGTPVDFQAPTLDGKPFDLKSLRGKIVLVDYWATSCSACIAAMPRIKEVYDRYREKGFEVLSVCFDGTKERRKVEKAEHEMGITWTTLAADGRFRELADRYGYQGVPQYMLLDREGRLVAESAEVDMGRNLEALLRKMLASEAT